MRMFIGLGFNILIKRIIEKKEEEEKGGKKKIEKKNIEFFQINSWAPGVWQEQQTFPMTWMERTPQYTYEWQPSVSFFQLESWIKLAAEVFFFLKKIFTLIILPFFLLLSVFFFSLSLS